MVTIEIFGDLTAWAPSRKSGNRFYNPKDIEKKQTIWQIKSQYRDQPLSSWVHLDFTFFIKIPKSTSSIRRKQMLAHLILPGVKPDTTNLQKFYEDCLKGVAITDDNIVTDISARKRYSEKPGVLIRIHSLFNEKPLREAFL